MKILVVGYTLIWKSRVISALPDEVDVTFIGDRIEAMHEQERTSFSLYIFGNSLLEDRDAGVRLLEEAQKMKDQTPTIVFSEQVDEKATRRINELRGILIRSNSLDADNSLAYVVRKILKMSC